MSDSTQPDPSVPPVPPVPPAAPNPYVQPAQPNPYAQPAPPNPYAQPAPPNPYAQPAPGYAAYGYAPKTNTLAIVSLVLAFFVSLGAVICGHIALGQIKRTGEGGRGLAIAGLIIGYVGLAFGLIYIIFVVALVASSGSSSNF